MIAHVYFFTLLAIEGWFIEIKEANKYDQSTILK